MATARAAHRVPQCKEKIAEELILPTAPDLVSIMINERWVAKTN